MRRTKILLRRALPLCVMLLICLPITANAKVRLNKKAVTISVNQTVTIKVKGTKKKAKWSSKNKAVATVTKKGIVKGVSAGETSIIAKVGKKRYTCKVTVINASTPSTAPTQGTPSLANTIINMMAGDIACVEVNNYSGRLSCESSNKEIATVANNGTILGKDYGSCVITVNAGGTILHCTVNVNIPSPKCYPNNGGDAQSVGSD